MWVLRGNIGEFGEETKFKTVFEVLGHYRWASDSTLPFFSLQLNIVDTLYKSKVNIICTLLRNFTV